MLRKKILIFCFLLALMTLSPSQGQCENWKEFFKGNDIACQYDMDSIHYPQQKKILGITVRNKEIVNVWIRCSGTLPEKQEGFGESILTRFYCVERQYKGGLGLFRLPGIDGYISWGPLPSVSNDRVKPYPIEPGSPYESLLKKVCP